MHLHIFLAKFLLDFSKLNYIFGELFKAIDDWYGTKKEISQKDVEQILDAAIKRAKHKLGRKIVGIFKAKDKDDLQILKEADFNIK